MIKGSNRGDYFDGWSNLNVISVIMWMKWGGRTARDDQLHPKPLANLLSLMKLFIQDPAAHFRHTVLIILNIPSMFNRKYSTYLNLPTRNIEGNNDRATNECHEKNGMTNKEY